MSARGTLVVGLLAVASAAAAEPPNVLVVLVDDMGWPAPACYGNRHVATPHMDRLAAEGMRFTQAYAESVCSPTRAALLSGRWPARTGMTKVVNDKAWPHARMATPPARKRLPPEWPTLPKMLREAGYVTGLAGKWHVGDGYAAGPLRRRRGAEHFDAYGFDEVAETNEGKAADKAADKAVGALTDDAIGFLTRHRDDKPWFFLLSHFTVHTPLRVPEDAVARQVAKGYPKTATPWADPRQAPTADYLAMLDVLDRSVGRLLDALDETGQADDTLLVFVSDNGGLTRMADNAPLRLGKGAPYEGGIRVPMLVRWPGRVAAGSRCDEPVHVIDLYPTLREAAGGRTPRDRPLDGVSLLPVLAGSDRLPRDTLFWHMPHYAPSYARTPCAVVRAGDWKLVHHFGDWLEPSGPAANNRTWGTLHPQPKTELFHLVDDPGETRDLADRHPERVRDLRARLDAWLTDTGAALPTVNPAFEPRRWDQQAPDPRL